MASSRFPLCSTQQRILSFNKLQQCTSVTNSEHEKKTHDHIEIIYFRRSQSFSETKNVTCETKIDELPKHETTRTFLLTSFLSSFVMMILIGLPDFFTCKEKEAIYLAIFAMIIHHVRCEIKTKTLSKKYDTSFPLLQTLDSFLTFDAILLLKGDASCVRHFCFVTHLTLIIRIVGNGA